MKKITLFVSSLLLCMSAMAQTEANPNTDYGTRLTPAELSTITTPTKIAFECSQIGQYGRFYNGQTIYAGSEKGVFTAENVFIWEPVEEGVAGAYYIKKAYGTDENIYLGDANGADWGTKENAQQFVADTVPTSQTVGNIKYGDYHTYGVRVALKDKGIWFNANGYGYNNGTGVWTVQMVYQVAAITINEVKDDETKSTVAFNKSVTEATYNITPYDDYTYTVASEDIEIAVDAASFTANNAKDVTVTVTYAPMGEDTGIESINAQQNAVVYDLTGRRVQNVEKGIYIVNGRKVVIK